MLYEANNPIISITRVARFCWKSGIFQVAPRPYSALALRLRGNGIIRTNDVDYAIEEKDIVYLPQGLAYTAEYSDTEMIAIHFVTANTDPSVEVYTPSNKGALLISFQRALSLWECNKPESQPLVLSVLYEILGAICRDCASESYPPSLSAATVYIQANYTNSSLCIHDLCNAAHISESALRQLFVKYHHKTPLEYINSLRVEKARDIISQGVSIADAAHKCGFRDPKYFARVVKKHLGCTPRSLKLYGK